MEAFYFLLYILVCFLIGFSFSKKLYSFYQILIGHLVLLFCSAVYFSGINTIAVLFIPFFTYLYLIRNTDELTILFDKNKKYSKNIIEVFLLMGLCYLSKYLVFYNYEYGIENIPAGDHLTYMNIAENFYLKGNENPYTAKNILFDLNFNIPYRYHEAWIASIFLKCTSLKTVRIFELIIWPLNYFLVSYTIYHTIVSKYLKTNFILQILISFLFIFFTINFTLDYSSQSFYFGVNGFPKLCINFVFLSLFIHFYLKGKYVLSSLSLVALLFVSAVSLYLIPFLILILIYNYHKIDIAAKYFIILMIVLFLSFYTYNFYLETLFFEKQKMSMDIGLYFRRYFGIRYFIIPYIYYFVIIGLLLYLLSKKFQKSIIKPIIYIVLFSIISGNIAYSILNFTFHDSIQFFSNIVNVILILIIFLLLIKLIESKKSSKIFFTTFFILYLGYCLCFTYSIEKFINSNGEITRYSSNFIKKSNSILKDSIKNRIGVFIPKDSIGGYSEIYDYRQNRGFLSIIDRNFELINISANNWDDNSFEKIIKKHKTYKYMYFNNFSKSTINIFRYRFHLKDDDFLAEKFIKYYKIEYVVTQLSKNELPWFISKRIKRIVFDPKSKVNLIIINPS